MRLPVTSAPIEAAVTLFATPQQLSHKRTTSRSVGLFRVSLGTIVWVVSREYETTQKKDYDSHLLDRLSAIGCAKFFRQEAYRRKNMSIEKNFCLSRWGKISIKTAEG